MAKEALAAGADDVVAQDALLILDRASKFYDDPNGADLFYNQMGVLRTDLTEGWSLAGHDFTFKVEAQDSGSYKRRGATVSVLDAKERGYTAVHGMSTGNFGGSLAIAASRAGLDCTVHLTHDVSAVKENYSVAAGATIKKYATFGEAHAGAQTQRDSLFAHPFGFEACIGQATLGLELVDDCIERGWTDNLIIPVSIGGGGHIRGVAVAVWKAKQEGRLGPNVHVVGAQTERNDTLNRALQKIKKGAPPIGLYYPGEQVKHVDALAIGEDSLAVDNLALIGDERFVRGVRVVSDREVGLAMGDLIGRGIAAESGAAAAAALAMRMALSRPTFSGVKDGPVPTRMRFVVPVSGLNASDESRAHFANLAAAPKELTWGGGDALRKQLRKR